MASVATFGESTRRQPGLVHERECARKPTIALAIFCVFDCCVGRVRALAPTEGQARMRHPMLNISRSLRSVAARPVISTVVVATLALGLGVDTAIFSLAREVLLRPLCRSPESDRRPRLILQFAGQDDACCLRSSSRFDLSR
jgi:hypothetical protein